MCLKYSAQVLMNILAWPYTYIGLKYVQYTYQFSRDVIFAVFSSTVTSHPQKLNPLKQSQCIFVDNN